MSSKKHLRFLFVCPSADVIHFILLQFQDFVCCYLIAVAPARICNSGVGSEISFAALSHAGTRGLTCCLATDCSNPRFTLRQLQPNQTVAGAIYRLILCLSVFFKKNLCRSYLKRGYLSVVDCSSWTRSSLVCSTTAKTVVPNKTASPVPNSWITSPR